MNNRDCREPVWEARKTLSAAGRTG